MSILPQDLYKTLAKIGINTLTPYQAQAIPQLLTSNNTILLGELGIGKTLSYILAISALTTLAQHPNQQLFPFSSLFTETQSTPTLIPHGALIILPTQEKLYKVYQKFRQIAPWLVIKRANNTLSSQTSLNIYPSTKSNFISGAINYAKNNEWNTLDVFLATPQTLVENVQVSRTLKLPLLNPKHVVIDEIDWICEYFLFRSKLLSKNIRNSFEGIPDCVDKHFILTSSVRPYLGLVRDPLVELRKGFKDIQEVALEKFEFIPSNLKVNFLKYEQESEKREKLRKVLENGEKIVVFCVGFEECEKIHEFCVEIGISSAVVFPKLDLQNKVWKYFKGVHEEQVVICSEIAGKGFEFRANHIVLYDLPDSAVSLMRRIGAASNNGQVTFIINENSKEFIKRFKAGGKWNSVFDLFKHKKSIQRFFPKPKSLNPPNKIVL